MSIIVYSKPACVQCIATVRALESKGLIHEIVDVSQDETALAHVQNLGYKQVPVVITERQHWAGFRPDKISQLIA